MGKKGFSWTKLTLATAAVIVFFILFTWGNYADAAEIRFGLGHGIAHADHVVTQSVMVSTDDLRWYAQYTRIGDERYMGGNDRLSAGMRVNWRRDKRISPYMRLGFAYFDDVPMPYISERLAFDMAIGLRLYSVIELEYAHNSTANRAVANWGFDVIELAVTKRFGK